jgi:hypothetical protein
MEYWQSYWLKAGGSAPAEGGDKGEKKGGPR